MWEIRGTPLCLALESPEGDEFYLYWRPYVHEFHWDVTKVSSGTVTERFLCGITSFSRADLVRQLITNPPGLLLEVALKVADILPNEEDSPSLLTRAARQLSEATIRKGLEI